MKTKLRRYSRRTLSVFLSTLILFGAMVTTSITTYAADGPSGVGNVRMVGSFNSWSTSDDNWKMSKVDSNDANHWQGTYYIPRSDTNYEFKVYLGNSSWGNGIQVSKGGYWYNTSYTAGEHSMYTNQSNDQIQCIAADSGYIKIYCEYYAQYGSYSYMKLEQSAVTALGASLSVGSTSLKSGKTTTLTTSASGGSGGYNETITVKRGSTDVTSSVLSGKTFTAPTVTSATTYTITYTVNDSHALLSGLTAATATKTITVNPINVTVSAKTGSSVSTTGGTVSPTSYSGVNPSQSYSITATPKSGYAFTGWTSSNSSNVTFASTSNPSTTFTATNDVTIYANFTAETTYDVTVNDGSSTYTASAGSTVNPELTAADRTSEDYEFNGWTLTGGASLVSGYSSSDQTIKIKATSAGTATANYVKGDYVYFYAALQDSWGSKVHVYVDDVEIPEYTDYHNNYVSGQTNSIELFKDSNSTHISGGNTWYYVGVYRINKSNAGTLKVGSDAYQENFGTIKTDMNGYLYATYSVDGNNGQLTISPQRVTSLTTNTTTYDGDNTITFSKQETTYSGSVAKTAGQDTFTYSMYAVNQSTNAETSLGTGWVATIVPDNLGLASGTYKFKIVTTDATTGKMTNTCLSSNVTINATPNKHTVTSSAGTGATYSTSGSTYKYGSGTATTFTNGTTQIKTGSVMTIKYTLSTGYTDTGSTLTVKNASNGNVSVTSHTVSGSTVTIVFTLPDSNCTVVYTPKEITHSITIKKRFYDSTGTTEIASQTTWKTISGAGIATAVSTAAASSVSYYTFKGWKLPTGVTCASGDIATLAAITVNATVDNAVIYLDYWENVHAVTLTRNNDSYGYITNSSGTTISSISVGNVTPITIKAVNNPGYYFTGWEKVSGSGTVTFGDATSATTTIKTTNTATVRANFAPADYTVSVSWDGTYDSGNTFTYTPDHGQIGTEYTIAVTLADGYEVQSITGTGISSTLPTPTVSDNTYSYKYTIGSQSVVAKIKLKAKTPTLSDVQVTDNSTTEFPYVSVSNGSSNYKNNYYKQPLNVKATTQSYATLQFSATTSSSPSYTTSTSPYTKAQSATGVSRPTGNNYTTYNVTVRAVNAKTGVATVYSDLYTFKIRVYLNDAQKQWDILKEFYQRDEITEETGAATYYDGGATQIATYNSEYDAAGVMVATEPDYNATNASEYTDQYNALYNALLDMLSYAKTTTFYVLTNVAYNASTPINAHVWREGSVTEPDYNHFKLYAKYINPENKVTTVEDTYHLIYEGSVYYSTTSNYRYLYSFTYAGHTCMNFWKGSSAADTSDSNKITGDFKNINTFGQYYVNVYNTNPGSGSTTSKTDFTDFNITSSPTKSQRLFQLNTEDDPHSYTRKEIINAIGSEGTDPNRTPKLNGSIADAPGVVNNVTSVKVTGPMGKATKSTITLASDSSKWTPNYQGRYQVEYTVKIGVDARNSVGATFEKTLTMDIWVAFDDIAIYVDMNGNVGTPILNFAYTDGGTTAYLPYEMDLVTGSESIYGYTIKRSKLKNDYGIEFVNDMLNIAYITVENNKIGQGTGFNIGVDSTLSGSAWFKADSTNLKTFNAIAYSAVENTFAAQIVGNTTDYLDTGIKNVTGTGIITDDEDTGIFKDLYAGLETGFNKFSYNVRARANEEITYNDNQYYFVKWVEIDTPASGEIDLTDAEDVSNVADLNINIAPVYTDTEGDKTYVALFKPAASGEDVRVQVKYTFADYDTSDGNYIFDINKSTNAASFTKTITVPLNKTFNGKIYTNFAAVKADVEYIAKTNAPKIQSFYFDYEYVDESADNITEDTANNKITATAQMNNTPHEYTIVFGSDTYTGHYQNIKTLETSISNPAWYIGTGSDKTLIEVGKSSIDVRYGAALNGSADTIYITVEAASSGQTAGGNASVITNSIQEFYTEGTTKTVKHNFYIVDFCDEGTLLGGGVVYATTDGNGNYRQSSAATNLENTNSITAYINGILAGDYDTEYIDQTINNVRFRYLPFAGAEDVFRYSDILGGYHYTYPITNKNDESYGTQTLRVYSYFIKSDHTVVVSPTYAEITRYVEE